MRYAIVDEDGLVINVVEWDGNDDEWNPPEDHIAVSCTGIAGVGPGATFNGTTFTPAPPRVDHWG